MKTQSHGEGKMATDQTQQTFTFQAEIKQLLDILVHSLYTEREIFLRELISNASDALNRVQFEMLTNDDITSPDAPLRIDISFDEEAGTLTISDTGIGMTQEDMVSNLGTIARSGAKAFIEAMRENQNGSASAQDVIGQFGVGFYSVFMVADRVRVVSKSYLPDAPAFAWESDGGEQYTIEPAPREERGTDIIITLKDEEKEFLQGYRVKQVIRAHSNYIAFPIHVDGEDEPTNKQTAIWRKDPKEVEDKEYDDFYKMMTMDFNEPAHRLHMRADSPLQFYALLYFPSSSEQNMLSPRREPGLQLYARKVLIQEYNKDILPEYLGFVQGVVDTEDLPLSVSRESVRANRVMANLSKVITRRVLSDLKRLVNKERDQYLKLFRAWSRFIKQGVYIAPDQSEDIMEILLFQTTHDDDQHQFYTLAEYVERMAENQQDIYYIIADDWHSARRSPHLDAFRKRGIEVLYFTEPVDSAMVMGLTQYKDHAFRSVDEAEIDLSEIGTAQDEDESPNDPVPANTFGAVIERFKAVLGERVRDVRESQTLSGNPARLVSDENAASRNMFRLNRLLEREYELPVKILELNRRHALVHNLSDMLEGGDQTVVDAVIEQIFETALLQDGIHPDPASMAERLYLLMQAATGTATGDLDFAAAPKMDAPPAAPPSGIPGMPSMEDLSAMMGEDAFAEGEDAAFAEEELTADENDATATHPAASIEDAEFSDVTTGEETVDAQATQDATAPDTQQTEAFDEADDAADADKEDIK